jgi:hypothetical protein
MSIEYVTEKEQQLATALKEMREERDALKGELGDLPEAQAEMLQEIKTLRQAIEQAEKDVPEANFGNMEPTAWARYPRYTGSAQKPEVVFVKPENSDWVELFAKTPTAPAQGLFVDIIAKHEGLADELAVPAQQPLTTMFGSLPIYDAPPAQPVNDFDMRGLLASNLHCWHRLTEGEDDELVAFVASLKTPAPQPLTDEQIKSMCKELWVFETIKQWVRIIEAAHGITGASL